MNPSGRDEEGIPFLHLVVFEYLCYSIVLDLGLIFLRICLTAHSGHQVSSLIRLNHIPHLGLALGTVVPFRCKGIVRVHLHRQIVSGIYEFDKKWKLICCRIIDLLPKKAFLIFCGKAGDGPSL